MLGGIGDKRHRIWAAEIAGTLYTDVMSMPDPVFLETPRQIDSFYPAGTGSGAALPVAAAAALPLLVGDKSLGSLVLTSRRGRHFRRLERELLAALARVGAQAMERALLYEQQSSLATTLQGALLPQSLPYRTDVDLAAVYLSATATANVEVGGDWYDVLEIGGSSLLLVVGDVMGKGVPPVLLELERRGPRLRLTVTDEGVRIPRPRVAEPDSTGGRGLFLVSALSAAWKIEPHGGERNTAPGTAVWAEFALSPSIDGHTGRSSTPATG